MKQFSIPEDVSFILNRIHQAGEEAYIVGGCVRDLLLKVEPNDWDITTSAPPEIIKEMFSRTIDTGLEHGTVTVMIGKEGYEVTTYRIDGKYEDHRRPKDVEFTRNLSDDLLRRDFTINAMAYNEEEGIIDEYHGAKDLDNGIIRCVGNPRDRFSEDALRMLRAIRFGAKLGFVIEEETYEAMKELSPLITHVSAERINVELTKTLISKEPDRIKELVNTGLIDYVIPEFREIVGVEQHNPYHRFTVDEHTYECLKFVEPIAALRWTVYLHDLGKGQTRSTDDNGIDHFYGHPALSAKMAKSIMKRLKFDNKTIDKVHKLVLFHDDRFEITKKNVRKAVHRIGTDNFSEFLKVKYADINGQNLDYKEKHIQQVEEIRDLFKTILADKECLTIKDLAVNGNDIIHLGVKNGKVIGTVLNKLLEIVLETPELNNKEVLKKLALKALKELE